MQANASLTLLEAIRHSFLFSVHVLSWYIADFGTEGPVQGPVKGLL